MPAAIVWAAGTGDGRERSPCSSNCWFVNRIAIAELKINGSKLPADDAASQADAEEIDDATYAVAETWVDEFTRERTPAEILEDRTRTTQAFMAARGLAEEAARCWAWVLRPGLDLPVGWSTPGADPEGAALAAAKFERDLQPAVVMIPAADTMLAMPIVMHDGRGEERAAALIAIAIAPDTEIDQNTMIGIDYGTSLTTMQLRYSVTLRANNRALSLAQAAAKLQRRLIEPTDRSAALKALVEEIEACDQFAWAEAFDDESGDRVKVAGFGDKAEPLHDAAGLDHAELEQSERSGYTELEVVVNGTTEGAIVVQSRFPLSDVEHGTLSAMAATVAGTLVRFRAAETIESLRRTSTRRLVEAQERERALVAADIHDGVLQQLGATAIRLELAQSRVEQHDIATASAIIADGTKEIRACARELRALLMELRPQVLDDIGLNAALSELGRHVEGVQVTVDSELPENLGTEFSITIFRIVQEALTNIQKHAHARNAQVSVELQDDAIVIDITDDGVGYEGATAGPSAEGSHFGLLGMRERAQMFGGSFTISGASGRGTEIRATLPLDGDPGAER